jgi:hypothetical protein
MRADLAARLRLCAATAWIGACGDGSPGTGPADAEPDPPADAPAADAAGDGMPDSGGESPCPDGLAAWYTFDEADGAVVDACGAHDGAVAGSGVIRGAEGRHGSAIAFDGTDGRVVVDAAASLDFVTAGTVELWINLADEESVGSIASRGTGIVDDNVLLTTECGNILCIHSRANAGTSLLVSDCDALLAGTWTHVAVVNDGAQASLYIDGALVATSPGGLLGALPHDLYFGRREPDAFPLNAALDDVKWWTVARTREEICGDAGGIAAETGCDLTPSSL